MQSNLSLFIAGRYLAHRRGKGFSSFISASSTIGIAIGVMTLIIVLSAMNGFEKALAKNFLSAVPHAELIGVNQPVSQWQTMAAQVQKLQHVSSVAPLIKMQGMLQKSDKLIGSEVRGVDASLESTVSSIPNYITLGSWQDIEKERAVVLGSGIADKLGVAIGDTVQLLSPPQGDSSVSGFVRALKKHNLEVVAVFNFGGELDNSQAFVSLKTAREIKGLINNQVDGVRLQVDDVFMAPKVASTAAYSQDHYVYIHNWTHSQGHLYNDIQLVRMIMFIVLVIVIAVASFNIVSTLIMVVNEKKSDIAILKTMGAHRRTIMFTFIFQGLTNGIMGTAIGGALGVLIAANLTAIVGWIEGFFAISVLSADIYFIDYIPSEVYLGDVVLTLCTALSLSLIATIYPSWQATKLNPAELLGQV